LEFLLFFYIVLLHTSSPLRRPARQIGYSSSSAASLSSFLLRRRGARQSRVRVVIVTFRSPLFSSSSSSSFSSGTLARPSKEKKRKKKKEGGVGGFAPHFPALFASLSRRFDKIIPTPRRFLLCLPPVLHSFYAVILHECDRPSGPSCTPDRLCRRPLLSLFLCLKGKDEEKKRQLPGEPGSCARN
jgi:hypothetical protein